MLNDKKCWKRENWEIFGRINGPYTYSLLQLVINELIAWFIMVGCELINTRLQYELMEESLVDFL